MIKKKNNYHRKKYGEPDGRTVSAALSGDEKALRLILDFYKGYICRLTEVRFRTGNDEEIIIYDEELQKGLMQKLVEATLKFSIGRKKPKPIK